MEFEGRMHDEGILCCSSKSVLGMLLISTTLLNTDSNPSLSTSGALNLACICFSSPTNTICLGLAAIMRWASGSVTKPASSMIPNPYSWLLIVWAPSCRVVQAMTWEDCITLFAASLSSPRYALSCELVRHIFLFSRFWCNAWSLSWLPCPNGLSYPGGGYMDAWPSVNGSVLSETRVACDLDTHHMTLMWFPPGSFILLIWYTRSSTVAFIGATTTTFSLPPSFLNACAAMAASCVVTLVLPHPGGPWIALILCLNAVWIDLSCALLNGLSDFVHSASYFPILFSQVFASLSFRMMFTRLVHPASSPPCESVIAFCILSVALRLCLRKMSPLVASMSEVCLSPTFTSSVTSFPDSLSVMLCIMAPSDLLIPSVSLNSIDISCSVSGLFSALLNCFAVMIMFIILDSTNLWPKFSSTFLMPICSLRVSCFAALPSNWLTAFWKLMYLLLSLSTFSYLNAPYVLFRWAKNSCASSDDLTSICFILSADSSGDIITSHALSFSASPSIAMTFSHLSLLSSSSMSSSVSSFLVLPSVSRCAVGSGCTPSSEGLAVVGKHWLPLVIMDRIQSVESLVYVYDKSSIAASAFCSASTVSRSSAIFLTSVLALLSAFALARTALLLFCLVKAPRSTRSLYAVMAFVQVRWSFGSQVKSP